ncbi:MAG TPA: macro domain-containing protein [Chloroflexota bacterium]|nr:macro domain-containing protein [Chloroflexota bacterium]
MITTRVGNILDSSAQTLVNTVNCVGVMGKGIALEFKKRFPEMFQDYVERCARREVRLGRPYLYRRRELPWVLNFATKDHWRAVSRLSDIVAGLEYLEQHYREWGITSLAVPPLGCGQGQLEWEVVGPTLFRHLSRLDIPVEVYAPYGTPDDQLQLSFLSDDGAHAMLQAPRIQPTWVALVAVVDRIEQEPYHWPIGRTMFQKIAYFASEAGVPTGLTHVRGSYGPFAPELKRVTSRLVNNGLIREEQRGRAFTIVPGPTFGDAQVAFQAQLAAWSGAIDRLTDLFLRMRTQQAEVAATVHFAARELAADGRKHSEMEVLRAAAEWKQRRRPPIQNTKFAEAIRSLNLIGWLELEPSEDLPLPFNERNVA